MSEQPSAGRWRSLRTMLSLAFRADPLRASLAVLTSLLTAVGGGIGPLIMARLVNAVLAGSAHDVAVWAGVGGGIAVVSFGAGLLRLDYRFRLEESTSILIEREIIELTSGLPGLEHHERPELLDELDLLRQQRGMVASSIAALVENLIVFVRAGTTIGVLLSVHPALLLLPLAGVPSIASSIYVRSRWKRFEESQAETARLADHLLEVATSSAPSKELRVFGLRAVISNRHRDLRLAIEGEADRVALRTSLLSLGTWTLFAAGYAAALGFVAVRAVNGDVNPGQVVLVVSAAASVNGQVSGFFFMVGWLFDTLKTVGRYLRLVDLAGAAILPLTDPAAAPDRLTTGIQLEDVTFRYPGTERDILSHVDLLIPAGATVAVVGENGAGKSTLMKLLCQFYLPTSGRVLVDGTDLARIPVTEWRARTSAGFQDFARYEFIAAETIGIGDLDAIDDRERIGIALERAAASDVVPVLPDGLDSMVGKRFEGGSELSGGQWQKLALARAMMRDRPLLLVLDEPTAALDADTEHELFERYAGAARQVARETGAITVLVSHRFSTVRTADLIVVVGDAGIRECGTHAELMAAGGTYAELFELQARAYR